MRALLFLVVLLSSVTSYGAPRPKNDSTIEPHISLSNQDTPHVLRSFGWFKNGFSLHDAAVECVFESVYPVGGVIALNGGTLVLNTDMRCDGGTQFTSLGRIIGNNRSLNLGTALSSLPNSSAEFQDLSLSFNSDLAVCGPVTIKGKCKLHGNGNVLKFMQGAQLIVDAHAVLELYNVVLEGVTAHTIVPCDETSVIIVRSVIGHVQPVRYVLAANKTRFVVLDEEAYPDSGMSYVYRFNQSQLDSIAIDSCCTSVNCAELLDSKIDACCQSVNSRIDVLQSEIDSIITDTTCCNGLTSRVDILESIIDNLAPDTSCCASLDSRIDVLQSEIDSIVTDTTCCNALSSRIDVLDSKIDNLTPDTSCCAILDSRIDVLQSEIDSIITDTTCCNGLASRLDVLESEIDACCTGTVVADCVITITGRVYWDPTAHPAMQPQNGKAVVFKFSKCWGPIADIPTLVFDPAVYGNGGVVELPAFSRTLFVDQGIIEVHDGVIFDMQGTDPAVDIPRFIVEERALFEPVQDAVVAFGGVGEINIRDAGGILMNQPSQIVIGRSTNDLIDFVVEGGGTVVIDNLDNLSSPTDFIRSLLTFQLGTTNILFDNQAILRIGRGVVEFNTNNGIQAAGVLNTLNFIGGSSIEIQKVGEESGVLRFSPNRTITGVVPGVSFNNRTGQVFGGGNMQFMTFGSNAVNVLLQVQPHYFVLENRTMQELFMTLGYLQWPQDQPTNVEPSDAEIVVRFGVVLNDAVAAALNNPEFLPANAGLMAALRSTRDGSAVPLQPADHDIAYNNDGTIVGYDINNNYFSIASNGARTNR